MEGAVRRENAAVLRCLFLFFFAPVLFFPIVSLPTRVRGARTMFPSITVRTQLVVDACKTREKGAVTVTIKHLPISI